MYDNNFNEKYWKVKNLLEKYNYNLFLWRNEVWKR